MESAPTLDERGVLYYNTVVRECQPVFEVFLSEKPKSISIANFLLNALEYSLSIFDFLEAHHGKNMLSGPPMH